MQWAIEHGGVGVASDSQLAKSPPWHLISTGTLHVGFPITSFP